ncbi:MAG: AraC family transcriptional regulator [Xanthobacteraceae bacterium]|jgi:AraC family transcriptional regulator
MALTSRLLACDTGWRVEDVVCTSGPHDRPFEERHDGVCIAAVTHGTFRYRSTLGSAVLAPGALLLGNDCHCFECSHDHGVGDRCLSFQFAPEFLETVIGAIPGARRMSFNVPRLPPNPALLPILAAAETARDDDDADALEEVALRVAGAVTGTLADSNGGRPAPSARDEKRISAALRWIEANADETLSLSELADVAAMSPYHFLRTFRAVVGITPHQYILHTRLGRAAVRLRRTSQSISAIAFASGFGDLSTFNRRFQRVMGQSPGAYRARGRR